MRTALFLFLLSISTSTVFGQVRTSKSRASDSQPAPDVGPRVYTIRINAAESTVKAGSKVSIKVVLANVGTTPFRLGFQGGDFPDYIVDVRRERDGLSPPLTPIGRKMVLGETLTPPTSSPYVRLLEPGKPIENEIALSSLYDLSQPGRYLVQIERGRMYGDRYRSGVKSNTIVITVVP
jgi:hypothetical protein